MIRAKAIFGMLLILSTVSFAVQAKITSTRIVDANGPQWTYTLHNLEPIGSPLRATGFVVYCNLTPGTGAPYVYSITAPPGWDYQTDPVAGAASARSYILFYATQAALPTQSPGAGETLSGFSIRCHDAYEMASLGFVASYDYVAGQDHPQTDAVVRGPSSYPVAMPIDVQVTEGEFFDGSLDALLVADGLEYSAFSDPTTLGTKFEIILTAQTPTFQTFDVLSSQTIGRMGMAQLIEAYRFDTNQWQVLYGATASTEAPSFDLKSEVPGAGFLDGNNQMKFRFSFSPINDEDPAQDGWLSSIDLLRVDLNP